MPKALRVTNRATLPPGGAWTYYDPDLDQTFEHHGMLDDFPAVVNRLRVTNGLPPLEDMKDRVEAYICENAPPGTCGGYTPASAPSPALTVSKVANFTRALVQTARSRARGQEVYNPDPNSAAKICSECPLCDRRMCTSCTGLEGLARRLLRTRQTTPYDSLLGSCRICGCLNRVLVHLSPEVIRASKSPKELAKYPDHCWIVRDLPDRRQK